MRQLNRIRQLRIALAQVNSTVGDFTGNIERIKTVLSEARDQGADIAIFPELAVAGYPPEDLLLKPEFLRENLASLDKIAESTSRITAIVGFVDVQNDLFNAAAVIHDGKVIDVYHKIFLPNYGVFDENRYFQAGMSYPIYTINGVGVGVNICEDIWYEAGPATKQSLAGAEVIINISSSPYEVNRATFREKMLSTRASDSVAIVAYCNMVGGQDELVFDGNSMVHNEKGELIARGKQFAEDLIVVDLDVEAVFRRRLHDPRWRKETLSLSPPEWSKRTIAVSEEPFVTPKPPLPVRQPEVRQYPDEIYKALVLGLHDYVNKNGFKKVVIGLSGGIDSSMTVTIAVDALGVDNVTGVSMPSRYSSAGSKTDAGLLARNLGIKLINIPIEKVFPAYLDTLEPFFEGRPADVTEENIQARIRGNILMALSNKFGWLVLATGDKSEMATGFTTLYGDLAGGFAIIKDVYKTTLYELARYRNSQAGYDLIPKSVLEKEPSPELRPNQKTTESIPPYRLLDPVLKQYVEDDVSVSELVAKGFDPELVKRAARLVDTSEYKRRQAPPGIRITSRAFGRDRRLPITNWFKG
jgi:NAD+ synthase (glutamine-hydrolysing)